MLFVFLFSSCQKSNSNEKQNISKEAQKETTITLTFAGGDSSWNQAIDTVAREFMEQYPQITVQLSTGTASSDIYADFLKKQDAVGELGDIVEMTDVEQYAANGRIVPLPDNITSLVNYAVKYKDQIYSVSTTSSTQGIIYNKKIFRQIGLKEPETFDEFLTICEKIKKYRLTPIIVGGKDLWHMGFWINHFFRTDVLLKNADWEEDRTAGVVSWTDAEPKQMLKDILEVFSQGYVNQNYRSTQDSSTASALAYGQAVMLYSGPWMFSQILNLNPDAELGWFYLPDENGDMIALNDIPAGWSITTECAQDEDKYEASLLFLQFFYSKQVYSNVCEIMNAMPVTKEKIIYQTIPVREKLLRDYEECETFTSGGIGDYATPEGFLNDMYQLIQDFIDGKYTIDETADILDKKWDKCIAK